MKTNILGLPVKTEEIVSKLNLLLIIKFIIRI
jgi:hypothetical protein